MELLTHVAVFADYYSMQEVVAFHGLTWSKAVALVSVGEEYAKEVVLKTFVANIFGDVENFKQGVSVIARKDKGLVLDLGLPMSDLPGTPILQS